MGKRKTSEHSLETEARHYLSFVLSDWVLIPHDEDDYGIDFSVKKTTEDGEQLQPEFDIQLKSSESYEGENSVPQTIDTTNLEDYMRSRKPVFLMGYDQEQQEIYWELIQQYIWENYGRDPASWQEQESVTIQLGRTPLADSREIVYELAENMEESIYEYVREEAFMDLMSGMISRSEARKTLEYRESSSVKLLSKVFGRNIPKIATGMANSGGGFLVIGFNEEGYGHEKRIAGIENPDQEVQNLRRKLEDVEPAIHAEININEVDGNSVMVAKIPSYSQLPHAYEGRFYIRRESNTDILTPEELVEYFN